MSRIKIHTAFLMVLIMLIGPIGISFTTTDSYAAALSVKNALPTNQIKEKAQETGQLAIKKSKGIAEKTKESVSDNGGKAVEKGKEIADKGKNFAKEKGKNASAKIKGWYSNINKEDFKKGWNRAAKIASSKAASRVGAKYINSVSKAIEKCGNRINASKGSARGVAQEAGFIAERWHAETFNIDSVAGQSKNFASVKGSNKLASPDIETAFGEEVSVKYYKTASQSANQQAKNIIEKYKEYCSSTDKPMSMEEYINKNGYSTKDKDLLDSIYKGQTRVIPSDQLEAAKAYLKGKKLGLDQKNKLIESKSCQETLDNLTDRMKDPKGTQSRPITKDEIDAIAELAMDGEFKPEDFGLTLSQVIPTKYILKQAINTGKKTGALKMAIVLGPELYMAVVKAIQAGEISQDDFEKMGADAITSYSEGFIEGSVSSTILIACQAGKFGAKYKNVSPDVVGALTVVAIDSMRYGYALSKGEITAAQYSDLMAEEIICSAGSMAAVAGLSMLLGGSAIVMIAGSMAGAMLASIGYNTGKQAVVEIRDAGGFAAVVPVNGINGVLVDSKEIASLGMEKTSSLLKGMKITTLTDGKIQIIA